MDESDPDSFTICLKFCIFGINGVSKLFDLALTQFLFPLMAFISPLCARSLKGCAKYHLGLVFVENL